MKFPAQFFLICKAARAMRQSPGRFKNDKTAGQRPAVSDERRTYSAFIFAKQSLQYTGLSSLGLKGTFASQPQEAQVAMNISLSGLALFLRASRQALHL
jgi:hypothetical protein